MENDELQQRTLLRPKEAAARFDVPLRTIYTWYQLGKVQGINMNGRSLRIFNESLRELLESRSRNKGQAGADLSPGCDRNE
jgi:excisionase family DNA binding protein